MLKFKGGENVKAGFYWHLAEWEAQIVPREGGPLAGSSEASYVRLPLPAVLVLAPLMGAVYAFFLPFIGIAMVLMYLAGRVRGLFSTTPPAAAQEALTPALRDRAVRTGDVEHKKAA